MKFSDTMRGYDRAARVFQELVESRAITLGPNGFEIRAPTMSTAAYKALARLRGNSADVIEVYSFGKLMSEGPKVFKPRQDQLEMLEQMQLNIPMSDYVQPYPTLVVEFPESFYSKKVVHCPQEGEWHYGEKVKAKHEPGYAIVRHELGYIFVTLVFSSGLSIKTSLKDEGGDIEECIESFNKSDEFRSTLTVTPEEWAVTKSCIRAALNYCLLLDEVGHRQERALPGLANPRKVGGVSSTYYELSQEVCLRRTVASPRELPSEATGKVMPPHHRRGHYKMQVCGPGRGERKRIRIAPVFVNSHLFLGKMSDARATYES